MMTAFMPASIPLRHGSHGFRRQNRDETDMILAEIRAKWGWWRAVSAAAWPSVGAGGGAGGGFGGFGGFGGAGAPGGGSADAAQISAWVQAHFTARTVGGMTVYNLTVPAASS
jgi:hypothetical protein